MLPPDNRISSLREQFNHRLREAEYGTEELTPLFRMIIREITGKSAAIQLAERDARLSESEMMRFLAILEELEAHHPIQYILGHTEFMGMDLLCDQRALIPRPETEELAQWVMDEAGTGCTILDIGTGTGALALALSFIPESTIHAMDLSPDALALAKENARRIASPVQLHEDDLFQIESDYPIFDIIVCNPPYIPASESSSMDRRVKDKEPGMALFVPEDDPLLFHKGIIEFSKEHLRAGGSIYIEGHKDFGPATVELFRSAGFKNVELRQDLDGHDRFIKAVRM